MLGRTMGMRMLVLLSLVLTIIIAGCGGTNNVNNTAATEAASPTAAPTTEPTVEPTPEAKEPVDVKVVLNWFAKTEHGGLFAAQQHGIYTEEGLNVTIEQGGPQVSSIQIVASGKADFGLAHADQILLAREQGIPIVAIATTFQISPQSIMFHEGAVKDFADLNGRTVFIQQGQPYWEYLKYTYKLDKAKEVAYTGQHANFISDKTSASQSFVTGEPYAVEEQGIPVDTLLVADSGYQPYAAVIYTTEKFIKENPEAVKAFVSGTVKGWADYKETFAEIDPYIRTINTALTPGEMTFAEEKQTEFIFGHDATEHGVGYMTEERWTTLMDQLVEIGVLKGKLDVKSAFTTDFLPAK